jgi:ribonuclease J
LPTANPLEIIPLGGVGEFGLNSMVIRSGGDCVVVDAGMMFPGAEHLGVDVVIPDFSFLEDCGTLHGVVLTHAHEDHVGALPYLLARLDVPVFASDYTRELVGRRLEEHGIEARLDPLPRAGAALELGPFRIEPIAAAHSVPQTFMLAIHTPDGTLLHTADFKLEADPASGETTDLDRLERLGDAGVLALLVDSTNADRPGRTAGEGVALAGIAQQIDASPRRVLLTTFASNVRRIGAVAALAAERGRKVALVGRSLLNHVEIAEKLGLVRFPPGSRVAVEEAMDLPPRRCLIFASGSQGEPMSALARIAVDKHRSVWLEQGDRVIHSARIIPGNEKSVGNLINHALRRGAEVVTAADAPVHVSGHASGDELDAVLRRIRPRFLLPIHGEYRQLHANAARGVAAGIASGRVLLAESGDRVVVDERGIRIDGRVSVGRTFIDAALDEVDDLVLRERRHIAGEGVVVPVIAVNRDRGTLNAPPEILTRGFVADGNGLIEEACRVVAEAVADASPEERGDEALLRARIQTDLKRYLKRRTQRRPLILPVIVEL